MGAELFHADNRTERWTDVTEPVVALQNFANAPDEGIVRVQEHSYK